MRNTERRKKTNPPMPPATPDTRVSRYARSLRRARERIETRRSSGTAADVASYVLANPFAAVIAGLRSADFPHDVIPIDLTDIETAHLNAVLRQQETAKQIRHQQRQEAKERIQRGLDEATAITMFEDIGRARGGAKKRSKSSATVTMVTSSEANLTRGELLATLRAQGTSAVVDYVATLPMSRLEQRSFFALTGDESDACKARYQEVKKYGCLAHRVCELLHITKYELARWTNDHRLCVFGVRHLHFSRSVWARVYDVRQIEEITQETIVLWRDEWRQKKIWRRRLPHRPSPPWIQLRRALIKIRGSKIITLSTPLRTQAFDMSQAGSIGYERSHEQHFQNMLAYMFLEGSGSLIVRQFMQMSVCTIKGRDIPVKNIYGMVINHGKILPMSSTDVETASTVDYATGDPVPREQDVFYRDFPRDLLRALASICSDTSGQF